MPRALQTRLHAARPDLSFRAQSAAVRVHGGDCAAAELPAPPELYPLLACMVTCLSRLEELSLDLGKFAYHDQKACPSILAPLAGLPHLARLRVSYPGGADIEVFQVGLGGRLAGMHSAAMTAAE